MLASALGPGCGPFACLSRRAKPHDGLARRHADHEVIVPPPPIIVPNTMPNLPLVARYRLIWRDTTFRNPMPTRRNDAVQADLGAIEELIARHPEGISRADLEHALAASRPRPLASAASHPAPRPSAPGPAYTAFLLPMPTPSPT